MPATDLALSTSWRNDQAVLAGANARRRTAAGRRPARRGHAGPSGPARPRPRAATAPGARADERARRGPPVAGPARRPQGPPTAGCHGSGAVPQALAVPAPAGGAARRGAAGRGGGARRAAVHARRWSTSSRPWRRRTTRRAETRSCDCSPGLAPGWGSRTSRRSGPGPGLPHGAHRRRGRDEAATWWTRGGSSTRSTPAARGLDSGPGSGSPDGAGARLPDLGGTLRALRAQTFLPVVDLVTEAERQLGLDIEARVPRRVGPAAAQADLDAFRAVAAGFADANESGTLGAFLAWLAAARSGRSGLEAPVGEMDPDAVQASRCTPRRAWSGTSSPCPARLRPPSRDGPPQPRASDHDRGSSPPRSGETRRASPDVALARDLADRELAERLVPLQGRPRDHPLRGGAPPGVRRGHPCPRRPAARADRGGGTAPGRRPVAVPAGRRPGGAGRHGREVGGRPGPGGVTGTTGRTGARRGPGVARSRTCWAARQPHLAAAARAVRALLSDGPAAGTALRRPVPGGARRPGGDLESVAELLLAERGRRGEEERGAGSPYPRTSRPRPWSGWLPTGTRSPHSCADPSRCSPPSTGAGRGTAFHAWVERWFGRGRPGRRRRAPRRRRRHRRRRPRARRAARRVPGGDRLVKAPDPGGGRGRRRDAGRGGLVVRCAHRRRVRRTGWRRGRRRLEDRPGAPSDPAVREARELQLSTLPARVVPVGRTSRSRPCRPRSCTSGPGRRSGPRHCPTRTSWPGRWAGRPPHRRAVGAAAESTGPAQVVHGDLLRPGPSLGPMDMCERPVLDLVVPVYNEAHSLERSVRTVRAFLDRFPYPARLTVADNASTDGTWRSHSASPRSSGRPRRPPRRQGPGPRAPQPAWLASDADVLAYMDVDLSTDLAALLPLVAPLVSGHSHLAIGTRLGRGSRVVRGPSGGRLPLLQPAAARDARRPVLRRAVRFQGDPGRRRTRAAAAREDTGWFFDTELLVLAERAGLRIHEVPVDWVDDPDSRVDLVATALRGPRAASPGWGGTSRRRASRSPRSAPTCPPSARRRAGVARTDPARPARAVRRGRRGLDRRVRGALPPARRTAGCAGRERRRPAPHRRRQHRGQPAGDVRRPRRCGAARHQGQGLVVLGLGLGAHRGGARAAAALARPARPRPTSSPSSCGEPRRHRPALRPAARLGLPDRSPRPTPPPRPLPHRTDPDDHPDLRARAEHG